MLVELHAQTPVTDKSNLLTQYRPPDRGQLDSLKDTHEKNPDNVPIARMLVELLYANGEYLETSRICRRILLTEKSDPIAWVKLGNSLFALSKWVEAFHAYSQALQNVTDAAERSKIDERMDFLNSIMQELERRR